MLSPEDNSLLDNPKFRQYINSVEKALKSFESSSEWADLISALGKLNKVLNSKFPVVPKKITIGKRLAQCLHPALPGGVHLKALDVYNSIFKIIGTERLKSDLYIYSMGIFPLLVNASMQVRPVLLNLYETHFLPLGNSLRSCVDGMLLGLLPGLEEGTEHFERTDILLERVCERVGQLEFFGAVWRCILSSSFVRLAAVQLILRRFNKKKSTDDQLYIIGSDIDVMVHALRESVQDSSVLTQRASLDVLILCCPLSNIPISRSDCYELLLAALQCILRRDMSLNRRLYSWLLGHDLTKRQMSSSSLDQSDGETYFDKHSKALLTEAILQMLYKQRGKLQGGLLNPQISANEELYPLKLLVSLLDKPEIGPVIIEDVLTDVYRLLDSAVKFVEKRYEPKSHEAIDANDEKSVRLTEISKTANLLLSVFEPGYIWLFMSQQLQNSIKDLDSSNKKENYGNNATYLEVCDFICLLLNIVNLESYQEIQTYHLPNLMHDVVSSLVDNVTCLGMKQIKQGLDTVSNLLELTQPMQPHPNNSNLEKVPIDQQLSNNNVGSSDQLHGRDVLQCSKLLNVFFCNFIQYKLSGSRLSIDSCMMSLETEVAQQDSTNQQHLPVNECGDEADDLPENTPLTVSDDQTEEKLIEIFQLTCRLLVDFACFPIYCNGQPSTSTQDSGRNSDNYRLPHWLKCLLWCICNSSLPLHTFFDIFSTSLSAILDLISLADSVSREIHPSADDEGKFEGTVSVVVLSPMTSSHVSVLTNQTTFYQHVVGRLWQVLGDASLCDHHLSSVQLLLRLHSMCSDARCEEVLLKDMLSRDKGVRSEALSKFCKLWHLTRTLASKKVVLQSGGHFKNFNRCLFAVLDSLSVGCQPSHFSTSLFQLDGSGQSVAMTTASSWLRECLEERDLLRMLEPLLMVMLHPRTHSMQLHSPFGKKGASFVQSMNQNQDKETEQNIIYDDNANNSVSSVMIEISKGKEIYRELLLTLTTSNMSEYEDELKVQASQIVQDVIKRSVQNLTQEQNHTSSEKHSPQANNDDDVIEHTPMQKHKGSAMQTEPQPIMKKRGGQIPSNRHMLVYQESFDASRVLYTLRSILTLLQTHPRLFTYTAVTSQLSTYTSQLSGGVLLQDLLARHLQVLSGRSFYEDVTSRTHNLMVVDVLVIVCLHYIRSWHPDEAIFHDFLHDIRCCACALLLALVNQMTELARENVAPSSMVTSSTATSSATSQQFGPFVRSVLNKYNVNEMVLESLATTVQALHISDKDDNVVAMDTHHVNVTRSAVTSLDELDLAFWWSGNHVTRVKSFQCHLLALVRALVVFDFHLAETESYPAKDQSAETKQNLSTAPPTYQPDLPVAMQPLFTTSLIRVLRLQSSCDLHAVWLDLLTSSLPYITGALPELTSPVTTQLCRNLEHASSLYALWNHESKSPILPQMPADYVVTLLKHLRTFTHFTLLLHSGSGLQHPVLPPAGQHGKLDRIASSNANPGSNQISNNLGLSALGSLFNVFTTNNALKTQRSIEEQVLPADWVETRRTTLRNLPRVLSCLAIVWDKVVSANTNYVTTKQGRKSSVNVNPCVAMGDSESVSQNVLQLLNPLALQYGENLLGALAVVWERRGRVGGKQHKPLPVRDLTEQQLQLLNVSCSIRALHCDVTLGLVKRVISQPPEFPAAFTNKKRKISFEECLLDFARRYLRRQTNSSLKESWGSVLALIRECISLGPAVTPVTSGGISTTAGSNPSGGGKRKLNARCHFLLLLLIAEYVKRVPTIEDKKDQKDMQDICIKCIEACNAIVDCSLEHGGWLARRAPSVLPGPQPTKSNLKHVTESGSSVDLLDPHVGHEQQNNLKTASSDPGLSSTTEHPNTLPLSMSVLPETANPHYDSSVQALDVLAQVLANLLDVIYGSEEKDKTVPVLTPVMTNVTPYLRNHSLKNAPSYRAAVSLLSSVSGYQQTRRAWKRDAFELFLAPDFFQMPVDSAPEWRNVIDHLMTHDSTTFKDLMIRIGFTRNAATGPSLNIFSNKDQELELRATLLKRLAFVIFSSRVNQYQRHLPEIQERLSESLRLHQVPIVQEQVYLCFRVLLLRVSPHHLTSLWPSIITELVQVMGQMEQELRLHDLDDSIVDSMSELPKPKSNASTPTSGVGIIFSNQSNSSSGIHLQEKWLAMYLSACKLLDLALALQPNQLTHFKMFRWSFVGEPGDVTDDEHTNDVIDVSKPRKTDKKGKGTEENVADSESSREFVPHCVRIKKLLAEKRPSGSCDLIDVAPLRPLLDMRNMTSLLQLQSFFNTIACPSTMLSLHQRKVLSIQSTNEDAAITSSAEIEHLLERDFVVSMN